MPSLRSRKIYESLKQKRRRVATQQIDILIRMALNEGIDHPEFSEKYAQQAWKLSTRFNVRLGQNRRLFCRRCKSFMIPLTGSRIRLGGKNSKMIKITCLRCSNVYRKLF